MQSIREHGFYRNVIVANDGTVLAGHGVVAAAAELGIEVIPVVRLDISPDDPKALKILTGDNEIGRLAGIDDRALADLLRSINDTDIDGLLGTGYDEAMLANLVYVSRHADEIASRDDAAAWVGLPAFDELKHPYRIIVQIDTEEERDSFLELIGVERPHRRLPNAWSVWWPPRGREDLSSLRFEVEE